MNPELERLLSVHRRARRRAEAIEALCIIAAGVMLSIIYLRGVI